MNDYVRGRNEGIIIGMTLNLSVDAANLSVETAADYLFILSDTFSMDMHRAIIPDAILVEFPIGLIAFLEPKVRPAPIPRGTLWDVSYPPELILLANVTGMDYIRDGTANAISLEFPSNLIYLLESEVIS